MSPKLPDRVRAAGISLRNEFEPGDIGALIHAHGVQNQVDYGFNAVHEAHCAAILAEFALSRDPRRSRAWLAVHDDKPVGSVLLVERSDTDAQLRLLFVDRVVRGLGLGRWLVEACVQHARATGFRTLHLWTVAGLDRAQRIYETVGFERTEERVTEDWGRSNVEVRYDLDLLAHRR